MNIIVNFCPQKDIYFQKFILIIYFKFIDGFNVAVVVLFFIHDFFIKWTSLFAFIFKKISIN